MALEQFRMLEAEQDGDARADAAAAEHGARDAEVLHHADDVLGHVLERIGRRHLGGASIAADVDADDLEPGREMRGLVHPQIVVERIGVDEHHRGAVACDLVPDVHAIGAAVTASDARLEDGGRMLVPDDVGAREARDLEHVLMQRHAADAVEMVVVEESSRPRLSSARTAS